MINESLSGDNTIRFWITAAMFNDAFIHEFRMHKLTNVFNHVSSHTLEVLKEKIRNLGCKALTRSSMGQSVPRES